MLNGSLPTPEIRLLSETNFPPSPFPEAEVFELHQDRDGKAVVDRGVFDVSGVTPASSNARADHTPAE